MSTTCSILSDTPDMKEFETTPPLGNNQAQAGIATSSETFTTIDPSSAIDFIKGKLTAEQMQDFWDDSICDAIRACITAPSHLMTGSTTYLGQVSKCWFSISFLDFLWALLFGKTNGNSPWHHLLRDLHLQMAEPNGGADSMLNLGGLIRATNARMTGVESLVREELGESPIIIHMPKAIMPTISKKRSEQGAFNQGWHQFNSIHPPVPWTR
ncbi:hypothetical protein F5Y04DRAFT_252109 [Hypomontagnella monticulosa]|nr:hypothetical protein F5Y04DRAFT_252109 [Hypomontagnella monticulosa]